MLKRLLMQPKLEQRETHAFGCFDPQVQIAAPGSARR
jgi:hypothetical protein